MTAKRAKTTAPEPTAEPLLDLPRLLVAIRRKRRMWLSLAVLGLIAGGMVALFLPPAPSAVTELLVVHENDSASDSGNLMLTDVTVLHTTKIAGDALKRIGSNESPEDFLKNYEGSGLTSNMMKIEVSGKTQNDAVRRAKALADAFIADHVARTQQAADGDAKALIAQRDRTQAELTKVNNAISNAQAKITQASKDNNGDGQPDGPANGGISSTESESQYARRAELTSKISDLTNRAETAGIGAPRVAAGTQIVDAPRAVPHSLIVTGVTNAAIGFGLMLAAGIAIAAIGGVVRDRPVLRKDIAENLGASVIAQLSVPRRGPARLWHTKRAVRERRRVAATLVRLVRSGAGPVSVLELGSRRIAAALVLDVATELAADRDVVIIEDPAGRVVDDDLPGRDLDELTGRADRPIRIIGADETTPGRPGETRVGVGSVTPGTSWTDLRHLGVETLLVVRTGFADTAWLHMVARQLADCQIPIVGVVLVDPDPRDKSDGTLWDGLYTALRGHGLSPAAIEARTIDSPADEEEAAAPVPAPAPALVPVPIPIVASVRPPVPASAAWQGSAHGPARVGQPAFAHPMASGPAQVGPTSDRTARPITATVNGPARIDQPATERLARPIATAGQPGAMNGPTRIEHPAPGRPTGQPGQRPVEHPASGRPTTATGQPGPKPTFDRPATATGQPGATNGPWPAEQPTADRPITTSEQPGAANAPRPAEQSTSALPVIAAGQPETSNGPEPSEQPTTGQPITAAGKAEASEEPGEESPSALPIAASGQPESQPVASSVDAPEAQAAEPDHEEKAEPVVRPEPKPHPERKPSWVPEPVAKPAVPKPHPERKPSWVPEPVAKPTPVAPAEHPVGAEAEPKTHDDRTPMPVHYPAPVPANGLNGRNGNADLPTKRFAPVQPHLKDGGDDDVHDLPTKRFAPVRPDRGPKS